MVSDSVSEGSGFPRGWIETKLGELGRWTSGGTPHRKNLNYYGGKIPWIKTGELRDGFIFETEEALTEAGVQNSSAKLFPAGTLLVAMYGATIGKLGITKIEATTNQACAALLPYCEGETIVSFLFHYLRHRRDDLRSLGQGGAQPNLSLQVITNYPVKLPPLAEQKRIVARLEKLEARSRAARVALDEVPKLLDDARQSLLAAAFRGDLTNDWRKKNQPAESGIQRLTRLRLERRKKWEIAELEKLRTRGKPPSDENWKTRYVTPQPSQCTDPLPKSWAWAHLIELEEGDRKSAYGVLKPGRHDPSGVRMLKSGQVRDGWLDLTEDYRITSQLDTVFAKTRLRGGEVLLNLVGASIGRSAVAPPEVAGCNISRAIGMIPVPSEIANYVQLALNAPVGQRLMVEKTGGSAQGVLNMEEVRSISIPLPPLSEQKVIVLRLQNGLRKLDAVALAYREAIGELDHLDQSLLAEAFKGKLVKQDSKDEPAFVLLQRIQAARAAKKLATPKAASKKITVSLPKLMKPLLEFIESEFGQRPFSFAQLRALESRDYEDLKNELYVLLRPSPENKSPRLKQKFDDETETMLFTLQKK